MRYRTYEEYYQNRLNRWLDISDWILLKEIMIDFLNGNVPAATEHNLNELTERCKGKIDFNKTVRNFSENWDIQNWDLTGFDFRWLAQKGNMIDSLDLETPVFFGNTYQCINFGFGIFTYTSFQDCLFEKCVFYEAEFNHAIFENCTFINCTFNRAKFIDVRISMSFHRCEFNDILIKSCEFESLDICNCEWHGAFLDNKAEPLRFSEAIIQSISFTNYQLSLNVRRKNMDPSFKNFHSIFICHNTQDNEFANRLASDLQRNGVHAWIDEAEIKIGDSLIEKIEDGIEETDFLGVVLTKNSVESEWVKKELRVALDIEIGEKKVKVLPLLLEDCKMPLFLREKLYADFRSDEKYFKSLGKVLDRLMIKANE